MNVELPDFILVSFEGDFRLESPQVPDINGLVRGREHDLAFGMNDNRLYESGEVGELTHKLICFEIPYCDRF